MSNGDNLTIGGFKDLNMQAVGVDTASIGSTPITLPNSDYNSFRANQTNNQTQFLGLTAQHTTTKFSSYNFDFQFGTTSGLNPYQKLTSDQGKLLHTIG